MAVKLNGFRLDPRIEALMSRDDWSGRRVHPKWFEKFRQPQNCHSVNFVELLSLEQARYENRNIRLNRYLNLIGAGTPINNGFYGLPNPKSPPGDFDCWKGYLIGFTDYVDSGIFVDLRFDDPKIIYDSGGIQPNYSVAFDSINEFVDFCKQHLHIH